MFPIEAAAGVVEITLRLDVSKLREDVERMAYARRMRERLWRAPVEGAAALAEARVRESKALGVRCYAIGLPEDDGWKPETIVKALQAAQVEYDTLVHGLYVLGIGFFQTFPETLAIGAWLGPDRLFRFTDELRVSFHRWRSSPTADLSTYVKGDRTDYPGVSR